VTNSGKPENHFKLQTSISSGKAPEKSSQTVTVEMEVDLLVPFGSNMTGRELADEEALAPLDEEALAPLKLETVPMVFAVPIG